MDVSVFMFIYDYIIIVDIDVCEETEVQKQDGLYSPVLSFLDIKSILITVTRHKI